MGRRFLPLSLVALALALALVGPGGASAPPPFAARALIVANGATGEVLYQFNADERLPIASITKVMTALVALERTTPDETVRVGKAAPSVGEVSIYLRPGERISVRDLLAAALIASANDAAYALASYVGGGSAERFAELMNERARELGLENTRFVRPDGLDVAGHYSSARDVLRLARQAMRKPLFRSLVRRRRLTIAGVRALRASNHLLRTFPGAIGVKTGYTEAAGFSEVAAARRGGMTIYAVLLSGPSREQRDADLAELLDWGFDQYGRVVLIRPGEAYAAVDVPYTDRKLRLVATESAVRLLRLGRPLTERVVAPVLVELPVERGQRLGEVCVDDGKRPVCRPLVSAEGIPKPSFGQRLSWYAGRALDHAGRMLESLFGGIF